MNRNVKMKWSLLISGLFLISMFVSAQPGQGRGPRHDGPGRNMPDSCRTKFMVDKLTQDLSLTAEQKEKVTAIHQAHIDKMNELWAQDSTCMARNRDQHMQLRNEMDNEIKALLSAEQKAKYDTIMSERRGPRNDKPGGRGGW